MSAVATRPACAVPFALLVETTALELVDTVTLLDTADLLIAELDALQGDVDLEPNGDELDSNSAEDDFCDHNTPHHLQGPGCPLSDPDFACDDVPCDEPYQDIEFSAQSPEWPDLT